MQNTRYEPADAPHLVRNSAPPRPPSASVGRKLLWWAAFGALVVVLQTFVYTSWIVSGDARPTPTGADMVPDRVKVTVVLFQVACCGLALFAVWSAVRGCRRERRMTLDARIMIGFVSLWFTDTIANFFRPQLFFNSYAINFGSWNEHIPFWQTPDGGRMPAGVLWELPIGFGILFVAILGDRFMVWMKAWWQNATGWQAFIALWVVLFISFAVLEILMVRGEIYAEPAAVRGLSLWAGTRWQFPLPEPFFFALTLTAVAWLRHTRDRHDVTVVERGASITTHWMRSLMRTLAVVGFVNAAMVIGYAVPVVALSFHHGDTPNYPSYLHNGICGQATPRACPGQLGD